jgi:hypothetical protein
LLSRHRRQNAQDSQKMICDFCALLRQKKSVFIRVHPWFIFLSAFPVIRHPSHVTVNCLVWIAFLIN